MPDSIPEVIAAQSRFLTAAARAMLVWMPGSASRDRLVPENAVVAEALAAQKLYYELRAPDYGDPTKLPDRAGRCLFPSQVAESVILFDWSPPRTYDFRVLRALALAHTADAV